MRRAGVRDQCRGPGARFQQAHAGKDVNTEQVATASSNAEAERNRKTHLKPVQKLIYGSGALADGMAGAAAGYLFFYMTAVCGLSGTLAGASLLIAIVIDSIADPLIGSLSDNMPSRFGRRHPWMLAAALPLLLFVAMLFSPPSTLKDWWLFAWMTLAAIGMRLSISLFSIPHIALGAELSDDYLQRSNIVAYRILFTVVPAIVGPLLMLRVFTHNQNDLLHRAGYAPFAWACGAIAAAAAIACTLGTRGTLSRLHVVARKSGNAFGRFARDMAEIFTDRNFVILFVGALVYSTAQAVSGQLGLHMAEFFWRLSNRVLFWTNVAGAAGAVLGFPLAAWLQRKFEKHAILAMMLALLCLGNAIVPVLRIIDVLPPSGPGLLIPLFMLNPLGGAGQVLLGITFYSVMADATDRHEYVFHARREGLFFSGLAFSAKTASALGSFIAGRALDWIGFPSGIAEKGPHLHIAARTITELALISGPASAALMALPAVLVLLVHSDRHEIARTQQALSDRRRLQGVVTDPATAATAQAEGSRETAASLAAR